ncbi:hypothetical protein [Arthrobacter sp. H14]|uniref:hypothetical protein n=1 Tax=Arthrobacter sp. H14 TaxID=1312959 RepID=UPI0004AEF4B0|nr:hypothetical protein [Arthrobacter sp. H14]
MSDEMSSAPSAGPQPAGAGAANNPTEEALVPSGSDASGTYLEPGEAFPLDLSGMATDDLHILNSRVSRQLDMEYIYRGGPHPETHGRFHELAEELDTRQTAEDAGTNKP